VQPPDDQPRKQEPSPEGGHGDGRESRPPEGAGDGADGSDESVAGPEHDLGPVLEAWKFGRRHPTVRLVRTRQGGRAVQVRMELGILQMELEGRPDGRRPHGAESLLAWHCARLEAHRAAGNDDEDFRLTAKECEALRAEGVQVYHRYAALFALEEFELVVRDTERNLRMFDLCARHGHGRQDRTMLEQYRPFVLMMRARAQAAIALAAGDDRTALAAIDAALAALRAHFDEHGPADGFEKSNEATLLSGMRAVLVPRLPTSQRAELEERLRRAVAAENFELAAILRDELRTLED
jgi:hypothetical protein